MVGVEDGGVEEEVAAWRAAKRARAQWYEGEGEEGEAGASVSVGVERLGMEEVLMGVGGGWDRRRAKRARAAVKSPRRARVSAACRAREGRMAWPTLRVEFKASLPAATRASRLEPRWPAWANRVEASSKSSGTTASGERSRLDAKVWGMLQGPFNRCAEANTTNPKRSE